MLSRSPTLPAGFIEPCLPTPAPTVPGGPRWAYEVKHDGFRFLYRRDGDRVRVFSPHGKGWSDRVPLIVEAMHALPVASATLDGEGVLIDDRGVTDFERLRSALAGRGGSRAAFLYAFDLLTLDGEDLRRHPWQIRRATLTGLLRKARAGIRLSERANLIPEATASNSTRHSPQRRGASGGPAPRAVDVSHRSFASIRGLLPYVCFTLDSDHCADISELPSSARNGPSVLIPTCLATASTPAGSRGCGAAACSWRGPLWGCAA
jgi:ATP dependent DNA ligase-like protein